MTVSHLSRMDFNWGWLGRNKAKEQASSNEDANPRHRRKSWSEIVGRLLVQRETHSMVNSVNPTNLKGTFTAEEV